MTALKEDKKKQAKRYYDDNIVKMGDNFYERCIYAKQDCLVYNSR